MSATIAPKGRFSTSKLTGPANLLRSIRSDAGTILPGVIVISGMFARLTAGFVAGGVAGCVAGCVAGERAERVTGASVTPTWSLGATVGRPRSGADLVTGLSPMDAVAVALMRPAPS